MLSSSDRQRVTSIFRQFGLGPRAAEIYQHALTIGPASIQQLAKELGQNRVTVHGAVEQLVKIGLLYETRRGKRRFIVAEKPAVLNRIIEEKERELHGMRENAAFVEKLLAPLRHTDMSVPVVKFYEGVDGFKKMLEETLSAKSEVLVFTYVDLFAQLITPGYLERYYARRARKGIHTRLIFPSAPFGKRVASIAAKYNMEVRFLPEGVKWQSGIFSWNDCIAIQSFTEGNVTCTIIENSDIAHFYRNIVFELCWKQAVA